MIEATAFILRPLDDESECFIFKDANMKRVSVLAVVCSLMLLRPALAQPEEGGYPEPLVQATPTATPEPTATPAPTPTATPQAAPTVAPEAMPAPPVLQDGVPANSPPAIPVPTQTPLQSVTARRVLPSIAAPSNLTAVATNGSVVLTWQDNSNNESGFKVERLIEGGGWQQLVRALTPNQTTYTDQGYFPTRRTSYRVRAFIATIVNSDYSDVAVVEPIALEAPSDLTAAMTEGRMVLRWRDNSEHESGFKVERSIAGQQWRELVRGLTPNQTSYTDETYAPSSRVSYRVRAFIAGVVNSPYSDVVTVEPPTFTISIDDSETSETSASSKTNATSHARTSISTVLTTTNTPGVMNRPTLPENTEFYIKLRVSTDMPTPPARINIRFRRLKARAPGSIPSFMEATLTARGDYEVKWLVTRMLGKWEVKADPALGVSNPIIIKINKRQQIADLAEYWANTVWPALRRPPHNYPFDVTGYPYVAPPIIGGIATPTASFSGCDGFVRFIYEELGLYWNTNFRSPGLLPDSGVGALRNFRDRGNAASARTPTFGHVAILVGNGFMVDVNNGNAATGPVRREIFYGVGPLTQYWGGSNPVNRGFPDPSTPAGPGIPHKTQLQALDAE